MKVSNIEQTQGTDGEPRWTYSFEGKKITLTERGESPCCKIGDEYPYEVEIIKQQQGRWYYKRKQTTQQSKPTTTRREWKPKNDDDIMLQVAFKGAVELELHHIVPEGKVDTQRVLQITGDLFRGLLLMRPKKILNE